MNLAHEATLAGVAMPRPREAEQRKRSQLTVGFQPETLAALEESARRKGLAPTALIRMWVIQQLDREQGEKGQ